MPDPSQKFEDTSKRIVGNFLQTAVFVDDKAFIDTPPGEEEFGNLPLDVKKVMDVFAKNEMICSVLKPKPGDDTDIFDSVKLASKRADVVVLDWNIHRDRGKTTTKIIQSIIDEDENQNGRLRLIVIYSSQPPYKSGSNPFVKIGNEFSDFVEDNNFFALQKKHCRIAFFHKTESNIDELPEFIISEFTKITAGLLSNVALESISVIRDNTHLLLGSLGREIDPAYLAHRALLPFPDDAMDHAVDIVASELQSILENYQVGKKADKDTILGWLDANSIDKNYKINYTNKQTGLDAVTEVGLDKIEKLLGKGFSKARESIKYECSFEAGQTKMECIGLDAFKHLTKTFCLNGEDEDEINCKYAILASQKNHYGRPENAPILTLGTVLKKISGPNPVEGYDYWICIQPRCDCVRITRPRNFIFLPLEIVNENGFGLIIEDENGFKKLKLIQKNYQSNSFRFSGADSDDKIVRAIKDGDEFYFTSEEGQRFLWLTELKTEHAQRISNEMAANLSRVGVNESEWLRLWSRVNINNPRSEITDN